MVTMSSEGYVSVREAAEVLGVVPATIRQMIGRGELAAVRAGVKLLRVRHSDVLALITPAHQDA